MATCDGCDSAATHQCGDCGKARYCSTRCQSACFRVHRIECSDHAIRIGATLDSRTEPLVESRPRVVMSYYSTMGKEDDKEKQAHKKLVVLADFSRPGDYATLYSCDAWLNTAENHEDSVKTKYATILAARLGKYAPFRMASPNAILNFEGTGAATASEAEQLDIARFANTMLEHAKPHYEGAR